MEFKDTRVAKPLMPLECRIVRGKETREHGWKMMGDKLIKFTSSLTPQTNPLPRSPILKGAMVRKE